MKWDRDSEAGKLLKAMIENGDIDATDAPKKIWESKEIFKKYDLAKFRAALNKLKSELGCNLRGPGKRCDTEDDDDDRMCSGGVFMGGVGGGGNVASSNGGGQGGYYGGEDEVRQDWMPIHTVFRWTDSHLRDRITVIVLMPSGIKKNDYSLAVVGGGSQLELTVQWPEMMVESDKLHEPFKRQMEGMKVALTGTFQDYLTRQQKFQLHLNELVRKIDRFESKCSIELPTLVHAHEIVTNAFGRSDSGTRVLYVDLVCECTDSNKQQGKDFFII